MVLCKHFQQGNCRFGSKCNYEHIDIKQLVKSDIESAINGKQYLFSCYGPFKDKPCIPNFIEDQSFEEIRLMCYEARQKNCFEQFHQQLSMSAADAMEKMKRLMQPTYDIMNILTMLYDTPASNSNQGTITNNANSFNFSSNTNSTASSIFSKSNLPQASNNNNNTFGTTGIFGGGTATNNMQSGGSIFGGQNTQQSQSNSIFAPTQQHSSNSIFGGGVTKPSIFGQQPVAQNSNFGLFGQATNQQNSIFGQSTNTQQQQQQPGNMFNQNSFGNPSPNVNLFAQPQGTNLFSQGAPQATPTNSAFFQQNGAAMNIGNSQQPQQQSFMQMQQPAQPVMQQVAVPHQTMPPKPSNPLYSRLQDLTEDEIAAFKADIFEPGKIPFKPPPEELIN